MDKKLEKLIGQFLLEYRKSDYGGWPKIETSDIHLLYDIIEQLIKLKCDGDEKDTRPIRVDILDRNKKYYVTIPDFIAVKHKADDDDFYNLSSSIAGLAEELVKLMQLKKIKKKQQKGGG